MGYNSELKPIFFARSKNFMILLKGGIIEDGGLVKIKKEIQND